jgi:hypothetical protein
MLLSCNNTDGTSLKFPLQALTRLGQSAENDIQLFDESASPLHCEIESVDGRITVRDLGSASGILVNGEPVQEAVLRPGDSLRIGQTEFIVDAETETEAQPPAPSANGANAVCQNHTELAADWRCSKCGALFCSQCIVDGHKFGTPRVKFCPLCSAKADDLKAARAVQQKDAEAARPLDPWKYPLRGEGLVLLIAGTVFMAITSVLQMFAMMLSGAIFVFTTGYLLAYSQTIIATTAHGDHEPPTWPDFSDFMEDILPPFIHAAGLLLLYLLPFLLVHWFVPGRAPILAGILLLLGLLLMPMAWLAASMHEQLGAISPHFVIPSVLRLGRSYIAIVVQLAVLMALDIGLHWALKQLHVPILPSLVGSFFGLYFLMVFSRLLGMLYYKNRAHLGWF